MPLVGPSASLFAVIGLAVWTQRRMGPKAVARSLTGLMVAASVSIVVALALVTVGSLAHVPAVTTVLGWCRHLVVGAVPPWLGLAATAGLAVICGSAGRTWRIHRQLWSQPGDEPVRVVPLQTAVAYSLPGAPGQIVVSSGMLSRLDRDERRVLFAHEQSHLRHRHHRYLRIADLAAAVPLLRPLRSQVRFAVERWADEDAAAQVGNRELVARTLARAALAQSDHAPAGSLAAAGGGVPQRVEALLAGEHASGGRPGLPTVLGLAGLIGGLTFVLIQGQRIFAFGTHLCRF